MRVAVSGAAGFIGSHLCDRLLEDGRAGEALDIRRLTGSRSELVIRPLPEDGPKQRRPDIAKARALLGWGPKVGLEEGLRQSVEYFRGIHAAA